MALAETTALVPEFVLGIKRRKEYTELETPGDVDSIDEIKPGTGATIRHGLTKVAVYRDESGGVHERSAICRHLGCVVNWNTLESTWDCPCHGSRYDAYGHVIQGPANSDLESVDKTETGTSPELKTCG